MVVVALLAEGVDRNLASSGMNDVDEVALLAEGVDRNQNIKAVCLLSHVALLAEGVDRNLSATIQTIGLPCRPPRGGRG